MSKYKILPYTILQAKKLKVMIVPSENPKKKIDVYKNNKKLYSIGDVNYKDFPTYLQTEGQVVANNRRRLYKIRHEKYRKIIGSKSYYSDNLLW